MHYTYTIKKNDIINILENLLQQKTHIQKNISEKIINNLESNILIETENFIAINKPYGISVHNGTNSKINLIDLIKKKKEYIELCHRLDKNTSGCLILAKNRDFLKEFHELMIKKKIKKEYYAIVKGIPKIKKIKIETKNILKKYNIKINDEEKTSTTNINIIKIYKNLSLIKIVPITGRLHQIRIHLTHIGHPIINDKKYGNKTFNKEMKKYKFKRMFLHSNSIIFNCPITKKKFNIKACYDSEINNFMRKLKGK